MWFLLVSAIWRMMLRWFLEPAFLVDPQTLVITFPSVLPHHPPFIIIATISLVPTALGACLRNWTEGERCEQPRSLTVFDRVNLSKLAVFSLSFFLHVLLDWNHHWWFLSQGLIIRKWSFLSSLKRWSFLTSQQCYMLAVRATPLLSNHIKPYKTL